MTESEYLDLRDSAFKGLLRTIDLAAAMYPVVFVVSEDVMKAMTHYEMVSPPSHNVLIGYDGDEPYTKKLHGVDVILAAPWNQPMFASAFLTDNSIMVPMDNGDILRIHAYHRTVCPEMQEYWVYFTSVYRIVSEYGEQSEDELEPGDTSALDKYLQSFAPNKRRKHIRQR